MEMYFGATSVFDRAHFIELCSEKFKVSRDDFRIVHDFSEFCSTNIPEDGKHYLEVFFTEGDYNTWILAWSKVIQFADIDEHVSFLSELSIRTQSKYLIGDEDTDPYTFIEIDENGKSYTVDVNCDALNEKGDVYFNEYCNHVFGTIGFKSEKELSVIENGLRKLISEYVSDFKFDKSSGPTYNSDFEKVKEKIPHLRGFSFYAAIKPLGRQTWYSNNTKSKILLTVLSDITKTIPVELCVFPADFRKVENIEGGSDSEEYCVILSNGKSEKVVYKQRRKSWLKFER